MEGIGEGRKVKQAELRLELGNINVERAYKVLRKYSNEGEITTFQLSRIMDVLSLAPLRPYFPFFQGSEGKYSLSKLAILFLLLSTSPQALKLRIFRLLWDTNCEGYLTEANISKAAEVILIISIDFPFSLVKDSTVAFEKYKKSLLGKRHHSMAREEIEQKLGGLKETHISPQANEQISQVLDAANVRKIVSDLEIPDLDRKKSTQLETIPTKSSQNTQLSSSEIARRRLLREELKPKLDKGPFE